MEITALIPTYRRPRLLSRAISSVLTQSYARVRVHVFDNASSDETASVVAEIRARDPRVHYHCHAENVGALKNYQYALQSVETPFFSFLADDDVLLPSFYETAMRGFEQHPDAMFSACTTLTMTAEGVVLGATAHPEGYATPPDGLVRLVKRNINWTGVLFRTDVREATGALDPEVGSPADLDLMLRTAARFPFIMTRHPAAIWLSHPESSCANNRSSTVWPGWMKMINNVADDPRVSQEARLLARDELMRQLKSSLFLIGGRTIKLGEYQDAMRAADILRNELDAPWKAATLAAAATLSRYVPGVHQAIGMMSTARRLLRRRRTSGLQETFGSYGAHLHPPADDAALGCSTPASLG